MAFRPLDLMEPEETVGDLWHRLASDIGAGAVYPDAAVALSRLRPSLLVLFRALGGSASVELGDAAAIRSGHRLGALRKLGTAAEMTPRASFDGERLRLPPFLASFPEQALNRAAYFWLVAVAAVAEIPPTEADPLANDWAQLRANAAAAQRAHALCPGLRRAYARMCRDMLSARSVAGLPVEEAAVEAAIRAQLAGQPVPPPSGAQAPRGYLPFAPVPIWLHLSCSGSGDAAQSEPDEATAPPANAAMTSRKLGLRKDASEAMRTDSLIIHRFEAILSWVESMNLNRSVDDDDDENAQKAAEDQDNITLSRHDRRAATRMRLHLDLSPADAEHERLSGVFTYPEWNCRSRSYLPDHCRVLDAEVAPDPDNIFTPNAQRMRAVRRQFETLRPRRVLRPRQIDGAELDLDALIGARVDLLATGYNSDRIYQSQRQIERDMSVAILMDTSRSTEAAVEDTCVIDVARDALAALAGGIDASGDRLGIWGFSSLRRDRVFLSRCKGFDMPLTPDVTNRICSLRPGHYTRLGAAIRHVSAMLNRETASRKLLLVLTDGKPNDLDHYEGQHGIEDSHMAVREARRLNQTVHGIIVDEDGQDWFARIFGRGGFTLLARPARLTQALPDIYRSLTQET